MPQIPVPKPGQIPTEKEYAVDIVFCLDSTISMGGIIEVTKDQIKKTAEEIHKRFKAARKTLRSLRARVLEFRDLVEDGDRWLVEHDWVTLVSPGHPWSFETAPLEAVLAGITATGGGGARASSLDALLRALETTWTEADSGLKLRKIVMIFTSQPPRPIDVSTWKICEEPMTDDEIVAGRVNLAMESNELRLLVVGPACDAWREFDNWKYAKWVRLDPAHANLYDERVLADVARWVGPGREA